MRFSFVVSTVSKGVCRENIFLLYMLLVEIIFSWVKVVKGITIKGASDPRKRYVVSEYLRLKLFTILYALTDFIVGVWSTSRAPSVPAERCSSAPKGDRLEAELSIQSNWRSTGENRKVLECYEFLNVMWLNDMYYIWMMKIVWNWCHTFGIMYELLFDGTLSMKSLCLTEIL